MIYYSLFNSTFVRLMESLQKIYDFIFAHWWWAFAAFFLFFSMLYFVGIFVASLFLHYLLKKGKVHAIQHAIRKGQKRTEILHSLLSIFIFALQAIPMQWLIHQGFFTISFTNAWNCLWEIPLLFLWNEIHFYTCHWLLHRRWFMKNVHYMHHQSKEPTLYSVFSFHWIEAFLLGTVIFFPLMIHSFHIFSVLSLPVMSIALNLMGHSNHETQTNKDTEAISRFTFRHTMHHKWSNGNFGFMLPWLDHIFKTSLPKNKN